jgi:2-keto-4-pentenoate hydratase/2-oxohepta-3-ene-1,7-dioic acid hydratase in catechol pathway
VIETELDPLERLAVICRVNDEIRQAGFTTDMVFGVAELVEFISRVMTLLPGDVILTGTPSGVGPIKPGDVVEVEVDGIGVLSNPVVAGR